jgi:hypothetical protein
MYAYIYMIHGGWNMYLDVYLHIFKYICTRLYAFMFVNAHILYILLDKTVKIFRSMEASMCMYGEFMYAYECRNKFTYIYMNF